MLCSRHDQDDLNKLRRCHSGRKGWCRFSGCKHVHLAGSTPESMLVTSHYTAKICNALAGLLTEEARVTFVQQIIAQREFFLTILRRKSTGGSPWFADLRAEAGASSRTLASYLSLRRPRGGPCSDCRLLQRGSSAPNGPWVHWYAEKIDQDAIIAISLPQLPLAAHAAGEASMRGRATSMSSQSGLYDRRDLPTGTWTGGVAREKEASGAAFECWDMLARAR